MYPDWSNFGGSVFISALLLVLADISANLIAGIVIKRSKSQRSLILGYTIQAITSALQIIF